MLPEELSADLCSLKEGVDRPCLAVRMVFDAHGHKRRHKFLRGVMRSAARLTYARAQAAFDGKPDAEHERRRAQDPGRPLGRLQNPRHRAGEAQPARPRPAGTAHRAGRRRPGRQHRLSRAAGIHAADRGMHGAGQCRRRRGAGKSAHAADLSRARHAVEGKAVRLFRFPPYPEYQFRQGPGDAARHLQPHPGARPKARRTRR